MRGFKFDVRLDILLESLLGPEGAGATCEVSHVAPDLKSDLSGAPRGSRRSWGSKIMNPINNDYWVPSNFDFLNRNLNQIDVRFDILSRHSPRAPKGPGATCEVSHTLHWTRILTSPGPLAGGV